MALFLYNLLNSEWFWGFVVFWVLLGAMWSQQRAALLGRLSSLVRRPPISPADPDDDPDPAAFYPRRLFLYLARALDRIKAFIEGQHHIVMDPADKMKTIAYVVLGLALSAFAFADYIAIANGLSAILNIDILLTAFVIAAYGVAVGIAIFVSSIIGFFVIFQTNSEHPWMAFGGDKKRSNRSIARIMSGVVILIALGVALFLGLEKLRVLGFLETNSTLQWLAQFGVHVMILINGTLSASLIFTDGLHGIVVVGIVLAWVLVAVFWILRHLFDYVWRLIMALVDILAYIIFTPLFGIGEIIAALWRRA